MATRTTLNVSLPVELGRFVEGMVESGNYSSASEVVRTALRLLRERENEEVHEERSGGENKEAPKPGREELPAGKA